MSGRKSRHEKGEIQLFSSICAAIQGNGVVISIDITCIIKTHLDHYQKGERYSELNINAIPKKKYKKVNELNQNPSSLINQTS
ncbi:hypothetical protein VTN00DRAFT_437 [Thermoascus crustaceus]|uniref:uncharacterized protein n=1 Tax=Thermoascus crustaceus TaxID=5088 RepID=UPI00374422A0